jgi:ribosomal subunit interface protein
MHIDIQARHFTLTDALRSHAEHRLRLALTCCDDHIQRIVIRLSDINGPRGGVDKHCHIQVVLAGLPDVIIEDTEADMYVAINRAADRAGRTLVRRVNRQQTLKKHGSPLPLLYEAPNDTMNQQERGFQP